MESRREVAQPYARHNRNFRARRVTDIAPCCEDGANRTLTFYPRAHGKNNGLTDTCTKIFQQQQSFRVNRPDWITSVKVDQANWDDHMQISVNGSAVWSSSRWYSAPPNGNGTCDLGKNWKLNDATPCAASSCSIDPNTVPFIDLTPQFSGASAGGIVTTQVGAIVGGHGEAFARMRLTFSAPPASSTNPNDPTFRACLTRTGSTN